MDPNSTQPPTYTPPAPQPNLNQSYTPPTQPKQPKKLNLTWLLIFLLILIILGLLGFIYMNQNKTTTPTPTPTPIATEENLNNETIEESEETQTYTSAKLKNLSYPGYTLSHPISWSESEERDENSGISKLTLSKSGYSIEIYQAPMGGSFCVYEGDMPEYAAADLRGMEFESIDTSFGTLRKTSEIKSGKTNYRFCQESQDDPNIYGSITTIGGISAAGPEQPDPEIVSEIDEIIYSITTL